jgi:hypothetical protein
MRRGKVFSMKFRALSLAALAACCLGASRPPAEAVRPFFQQGYESIQVSARQHSQEYHEGIMITGTAGYIAQMEGALELIERTDSRSWYFVRKHIRKITLTGHSGMDVGGGRFTSGEKSDEGAASTAGGIVHDAWHRELYVRGEPWEGREAEVFCLEKQNEVLGKLKSPLLDIEEVLKSEYWRTDYRSRDW